MNRNENKLWTRNFTIITVGSAVSMLGNSLGGFAMGLMVLDYTSSTLLYSLYLILYTLPQLLTPLFGGALLDRVSRARMIYSLDFIAGGLYLLMAGLLSTGWFSFPVFGVYMFLVGIISSLYNIAYESLYPMLITPGNFSKAYSVTSTLNTLTQLMVPVSAFLYNLTGIAPLLAINGACFLIAAVFELGIRTEESYIAARGIEDEQAGRQEQAYGKKLVADIGAGFRYLYSEKALFLVALYFGVNSLACGTESVLALPWFKASYPNAQVSLSGEYVYILVSAMGMIGRILSGLVLYRLNLPVKWKYVTALLVYLLMACLQGSYLFCPVWMMLPMLFFSGMLGVISYTIRISATQSYVPDEMKGRFNGAFTLLSTLGSLGGQALAGALSVGIAPRLIVLGAMAFNFASALALIGGGKKHIAPLYNRQQ